MHLSKRSQLIRKNILYHFLIFQINIFNSCKIIKNRVVQFLYLIFQFICNIKYKLTRQYDKIQLLLIFNYILDYLKFINNLNNYRYSNSLSNSFEIIYVYHIFTYIMVIIYIDTETYRNKSYQLQEYSEEFREDDRMRYQEQTIINE